MGLLHLLLSFKKDSSPVCSLYVLHREHLLSIAPFTFSTAGLCRQVKTLCHELLYTSSPVPRQLANMLYLVLPASSVAWQVPLSVSANVDMLYLGDTPTTPSSATRAAQAIRWLGQLRELSFSWVMSVAHRLMESSINQLPASILLVVFLLPRLLPFAGHPFHRPPESSTWRDLPYFPFTCLHVTIFPIVAFRPLPLIVFSLSNSFSNLKMKSWRTSKMLLQLPINLTYVHIYIYYMYNTSII